jgi:hypothetical protein
VHDVTTHRSMMSSASCLLSATCTASASALSSLLGKKANSIDEPLFRRCPS